MIKILFVCHGNICRSPMAEYIMKNLIKEYPKEQFHIASAATSTEEIGNGVYPPVKALLKEKGIDTSQKRAVQITEEDYQNYDYLIAMDQNNLHNLKRRFGNSVEEKVTLLLSYTGSDADISDPWYSRDFVTCYKEVLAGCQGLLTKIITEG